LPASILADAAFAPVISAETRLPLFRGPRLRMGLAEGQPNSLLPDHAGRANYYGGSVNRAARFMVSCLVQNIFNRLLGGSGRWGLLPVGGVWHEVAACPAVECMSNVSCLLVTAACG